MKKIQIILIFLVLSASGQPVRMALAEDNSFHYLGNTDLWAQKAKLTASDGSDGENFGASSSISGDTLVVGARYSDNYTGAAYVFEKPIGNWVDMTETAKLTASDGAENEYFSYDAVAISGDTIVVGCFTDNGYRGAAYVFEKPVGGWVDMTETAKLSASDGAASDVFGHSVAINGDTVVVGAYGDDNPNYGSGSAYVFEKPAGGWIDMTETAKLSASDGAVSDAFGCSVAISGDTVVVGANGDNDPPDSGSAYIFVKPESGWVDMTEMAKLTTSDGAEDDEFGSFVAISKDTVVVGAPGVDTTNGVTYYDVGRAYVFEKPMSGWVDMTQTARLNAGDGAAINQFGYCVSISGDTVAIGAWGADSYRGAAYVFDKPLSGWADMTETARLAANDGVPYDDFGYSVAISVDSVVVGAHGDDDNGNTSGSAYLFMRTDLCKGDFEPDGDVDGSDLVAYSADPGDISTDDFATDFGRNNCP